MSDQEDEGTLPPTVTEGDNDAATTAASDDEGEELAASSEDENETAAERRAEMVENDESAPLTPAQKRAAALATAKREEAAASSGNMRRYIDLFGIMFVLAGMAWPLVMGDGRDKPPKLGVVELDQSFYKTVLYPEKAVWDKLGPNDANVSWAVFFHKPYCGACRRVRPMFHALAAHTNASHTIRFGSVDCVKYRVFCQREHVDREPLIRLYQALPASIAAPVLVADEGLDLAPNKKKKSSTGGSKFVRRGVADWKGVLVAYEVFAWFKQLTNGPLAGHSVVWPTDDVLAVAMAEFKASKAHTGVSTSTTTTPQGAHDPNGYLKDLDSALLIGLVDDVFGGHTSVLEGRRLETMVNFLEVVSFTHPAKATRLRLAALKDALNRKEHWSEAHYAQLLAAWGHHEPPPTGADVAGAPTLHYQWCRSNAPGVGGYPCGLWILFHTMLANSDGKRAHLTLQIIYDWTQAFYGCVECAANFAQEWEQEGGEDQFGHVPASLWLWRVHNMVRARLTDDDDTVAPKPQWPSPAQCHGCFYNETLAAWGLGGVSPAKQPAEYAAAAAQAEAKHLVAYQSEAYAEDYVFAYLQETFCAASDTFVCSGFTGM